MSSDAAGPGYHDRPNPEQPWRYVCPHCDSHAIVIRRGKMRTPGFDARYKKGGEDIKANARKQYYCQRCRTRHAKVVDKKTENLADPLGGA